MNVAEEPIPMDDYPAAHSMDTIWYGVDEDGEIGVFWSGPDGEVPKLDGQKPIVRQGRESHFYAPNYFSEYDDVREHIDVDNVHSYDCERDFDVGYYLWEQSPEKAMRFEEIPEEFRNGRYFVFLKGFRFSTREPINPYDYAPCYSSGENEFFPSRGDTTRFPAPEHANPWSIELFNEVYYNNWEESRVFFACDDDGCLALFRTDLFGAIPAEKTGPDDATLWDELVRAGPDSFPIPYRFEELGAPKPIEEIYDFENDGWLIGVPLVFLLDLKFIPEKHARVVRTGDGIIVTFSHRADHYRLEKAMKAGLVKGAWREWPRHWLEYPFGPASPRMWGIYHYDASWLYPTPYLRIATPRDPLRVAQLPGVLRERMKPVRLPGVRFKDSARVQPFESVPCVVEPYSKIYEYFHFPDHWIDARLERMHPCHEFSVKVRDEEFVLRQTRRYVEFVEGLGRSIQQ